MQLCDCGIAGGWLLVLAQFEAFSFLQMVQLPLMLLLWWGYVTPFDRADLHTQGRVSTARRRTCLP